MKPIRTIDDLIGQATRILFFTGKGGVGKTSLSCATALTLSKRGRRVLLVSTDPASNLDEVLETRLTDKPGPIAGATGLYALNIDPELAAAAYRERVVGPYRGILPTATLASMEEQLSGACTVEIAAFDQFTKLLGDPDATAGFDRIIFDTAPTGHTIRLLSLPAAWTGFIATNTTGTSCLGPLAGLESQKHLYAQSLSALADGALSTLVLVTRPERSALAEAERTREELAAIGMRNQVLIVNGTFTRAGGPDPIAAALESRGKRALAGMPAGLAALPRIEVPLSAVAPMGLHGLTALFTSSPMNGLPPSLEQADWPDVAGLVDAIERDGRGVVMTMGKGGVGKTTVAAAIAIALADRGHRVHLSTTDPAAHVFATVNGEAAGLRISRIDPALETAKYKHEVMSTAGAELDEQGRALLEEDLRSPCTEEIAVFRAFADLVVAAEDEFVVLDTAPTGHTLLLLDAAEAYHREVSRKMSDMPESVRRLLPRLRDPRFTRVILVTLPEATPVHEAARLQADLSRAGIQTYAWLVNQSLAATGVSDPMLRRRALSEVPFIREVETALSRRFALLPWTAEEPVGPERLRSLLSRKELVNQ
jgi:arsenite/tail-anchored protein-transporting ATPase